MPARGKQKREPGLVEGAQHRRLGSLQMNPEGLEHIGRAHLAAGAAVAVLGHLGPAGGGREGHGGRNIEAVGPITARPAGVDQGECRSLGG